MEDSVKSIKTVKEFYDSLQEHESEKWPPKKLSPLKQLLEALDVNQDDDDILSFFEPLLSDENPFFDLKAFPASWRKHSTVKNNISILSSLSATNTLKNVLDNDQCAEFKDVCSKLTKFINDSKDVFESIRFAPRQDVSVDKLTMKDDEKVRPKVEKVDEEEEDNLSETNSDYVDTLTAENVYLLNQIRMLKEEGTARLHSNIKAFESFFEAGADQAALLALVSKLSQISRS